MLARIATLAPLTCAGVFGDAVDQGVEANMTTEENITIAVNSTIQGWERQIAASVPTSHGFLCTVMIVCCVSCCFFVVYNRQELKVRRLREAQRTKMEELIENANTQGDLERLGDDLLQKPIPSASDYRPTMLLR